MTYAQTCLVTNPLASVTPPTNVKQMIYSPTYGRLVIKNAGSAIASIDLGTGQSTMRLSKTSYADLTVSPSGRYVFGADYGGENIGYGTPASLNFVDRLDLVSNTWESKTAYIAGGIQAISDDQFILKSKDQWVTFTNNAWGTGTVVVPLNTSSGSFYGPGYYASVYFGDFRYDVNTGRLLHGNTGSSSSEIQAFKIIANEFVRQEGSGTYGSAGAYGANVALATDGSAFYYGRLQVDPLDVTFNRRVFVEPIFAATGTAAFGNGKYFDAITGELMGTLGFDTTVYALNPNGQDFWAFDASQNLLRHFAFARAPCATPPAPIGASATFNTVTKNLDVSWTGISGATSYNIYIAKQFGVTKSNYASLGGVVRSSATSTYSDPAPTAGYYYLVVTALNGSGESTESVQVSVTVPDTSAPTTPSGLSATALNGAQVLLTWNASIDNIGINFYSVQRAGAFASFVYSPQTRYTDGGLLGLTTYSYTVRACDSAYNCSTESAPVSVTTLVRTTPDLFNFNSQTGVPRVSTVESNNIVVSGISGPAAISISGGEYSIGGGVFTSNAGFVTNNQSITVRLTSSASYGATSIAILTVGGVSASFYVNTVSQPLSAVYSRKTHGASDRDIPIDFNLPLGGAIATEPRTIGTGHKIAFQFYSAVSSAGTAIAVDSSSTPVGSAVATINPSRSNEVIVTLTAIPDNKRVVVMLTGVNGNLSVSAPVGFLVGDVNNTQSVNASDVSGVKARAGQLTTALNYRFDVNADGAVNSADISTTKARSGLTLPE